MHITTETETEQVTLAPEIRDYLKLVSGSRIKFVINDQGQVKLFPLNVEVEPLSGILHWPGIAEVSHEDMEAAIIEAANDWT
ncbi:hypothetical protein [Synechococcus sp. PCC 6312]|uniref:AbrB/MazE/SpoVT family DNA-binding domain-containing protein n=1 Tax=Synechococcus sp. (strain ATCC 27167 / PCC 6312) TaxID=195253 RepID=UPI00029EFA26|nr:hypothetical protein [Synechococcus sp. PCC 6312]AFY59390.1 transcriptional regulator, AbrB family [Synechococcus sp. PCC 6312]